MQFSQVIAGAMLAGSVAASPAISAPKGNFTDEMLKGHHFYRAQHSAKDVKWNTTLAKLAQTKINTCVFDHDYDSPYGENLAYNSETTWGPFIDQWGSERTEYNFSKPGFSEETGHFTQLVWKETTHIGCAYTTCKDYGTLLSCFYDPPGNIDGDNNSYYKTNVNKQVSGKPTDTYAK